MKEMYEEFQIISIVSVYSQIMTPALNTMRCKVKDKNICIWQEHVRTGIVRSIVECCYPYVLREKRRRNHLNVGKAVILCPPEEYHDLGARVVTDYFEMSGYDATFVGANTPIEEIYTAIQVIEPQIVAISVSNYYNLIATKKLISKIKKSKYKEFKIVVGGRAFENNPDCYKQIDADHYIKTFEDIEKITGNEVVL